MDKKKTDDAKKKSRSYPIFPMIKRMMQNVKEKNPRLFARFGFYTIATGIYPLFAVMFPKLVLDELVRPSGARIEWLGIIVGSLFVLSAVFGYISVFLLRSTRYRLTALRLTYVRDRFQKLITMDYKYMEDANFYNDNERAMNACTTNETGMEGVYHRLFQAPAELLTILILSTLVGTQSLLILVAILINVAAVMFISRKTHEFQHSLHSEIGKQERRKFYYSTITQDFAYGKDIRIYSLKDRIMKNFRHEIDIYVALFDRIRHKEFLFGLIGLFTLLLSDVTTYGILIRDTINGMSIADFSMYLSATLSLSLLLKSFATKVSEIINEGEYIHDFYAFMDTDFNEKGGDVPAVTEGTLEIEFKNVSFCYPKTDKYIFKDLNFKINKGERLAIVGINGAGKTTIVKLITGLFAPTEGEVLINGVPVQEYNRSQLFSMFSVVFQDVNVLAFSLLENITCVPDGNREKAETALERAGLGAKLKSLSKGLDQPMLKIIEEDGTEFSGGENQKLAIARALYKDANMVIMDEPTAALDAMAEAEIYEHFSDLVAGKTAVYVSHRLASTKFCDKIAFFDGNGLSEYGNHDELMALKGKYYHMFTVQGKYYNLNLDDGGAA